MKEGRVVVKRGLGLAAIVCAALVGCSSEKGPAPASNTGFGSEQTPPPHSGGGMADSSMFRTIYFDFDQFDIKAEYRPIVEAHAKYLRENPGAKALIQGNADERGSREYNVGLGQRRSDAVKKMMTLLGVRESQIESVSLGEEKPSCAEHTEDCWAKNRRADVLYGGEY